MQHTMGQVAVRPADNCGCRSGDSPSARKHGVSDDGIRPALGNATAAFIRPEQPDFPMLIGPDAPARLFEIGFIEADDQDCVIRTMEARNKCLAMLDTSGGDPT